MHCAPYYHLDIRKSTNPEIHQAAGSQRVWAHIHSTTLCSGCAVNEATEAVVEDLEVLRCASYEFLWKILEV